MLRVSNRLNSLLLSGVVCFSIVPMSGCVKNSKEDEHVYSTGTHKVISVDRSIDLLWGKDGLYGLKVPDGYKIVDYDYDKTIGFEFEDYLFENDEEVVTSNPDKIGKPTSDDKNLENSNIYKPGEHVITSVNRCYNPFLGKGDTKFHLSAPTGYKILNYDYDYSFMGKSSFFNFENITYVNTCEVLVDDINSFGSPVNEISNDKSIRDNKRDAYQDIVVVLNRNVELLGKDGMRQLKNVPGYKIIDYDYDKTGVLSFETIVYQNTVPVSIDKDDDFGTLLEDGKTSDYEDSIYKSGEHVLVDINKDISLLIGYDGSKECSVPDGYTLLDYDYEKNSVTEFETYVYVNDSDVEVQNEDDFGKVVVKR